MDDLVPKKAMNGGENHFRSTRDILIDKHSLGKQPEDESLLTDNPEPINSILFDRLDAEAMPTDSTRQVSRCKAYWGG